MPLKPSIRDDRRPQRWNAWKLVRPIILRSEDPACLVGETAEGVALGGLDLSFDDEASKYGQPGFVGTRRRFDASAPDDLAGALCECVLHWNQYIRKSLKLQGILAELAWMWIRGISSASHTLRGIVPNEYTASMTRVSSRTRVRLTIGSVERRVNRRIRCWCR